MLMVSGCALYAFRNDSLLLYVLSVRGVSDCCHTLSYCKKNSAAVEGEKLRESRHGLCAVR
jgi:hypothetical protein